MGSPYQHVRRLPTPPDDSNLPPQNPPANAPGAPNLAPPATISDSLSDYDAYRARANASTAGVQGSSTGTGKTQSLSETVEERWEEAKPEEQERYRRKEEEDKAAREQGEGV